MQISRNYVETVPFYNISGKMEYLEKIVNGYKIRWIIFVKRFILDVWQGSKYASSKIISFESMWCLFC